jgi:hypothetical protein
MDAFHTPDRSWIAAPVTAESLTTTGLRGERFMQKLSRAALAMFLTMGVSGLAIAGNQPATGLGQAWPNAEDVSASPNWHVYVFVLNGIKYVQVNSLNGDVLGAIGTAGGRFITLPMGRFSQYVSVPHQATDHRSDKQNAATSTTVYEDDTTIITVTPQSDGTLLLTATCQDPEECQGG